MVVKKKWTVGATTGDPCPTCGAEVYPYYETRWYGKGDRIPLPADDTTWHWVLWCERGHSVPVPQAEPVQLSLLEEV